jgi:hypothetical protein
LPHVEDGDLTGRTCSRLNGADNVFTTRTPGAEHLDSSLLVFHFLFTFLHSFARAGLDHSPGQRIPNRRRHEKGDAPNMTEAESKPNLPIDNTADAATPNSNGQYPRRCFA